MLIGGDKNCVTSLSYLVGLFYGFCFLWL